MEVVEKVEMGAKGATEAVEGMEAMAFASPDRRLAASQAQN